MQADLAGRELQGGGRWAQQQLQQNEMPPAPMMQGVGGNVGESARPAGYGMSQPRPQENKYYVTMEEIAATLVWNPPPLIYDLRESSH
jgi:hypothetical protein